MRDPQRWRRAILRRAAEKGWEPAVVVAEFLPLIHEPPESVTEPHARELASDFPFEVGVIILAFTHEPQAVKP